MNAVGEQSHEMGNHPLRRLDSHLLKRYLNQLPSGYSEKIPIIYSNDLDKNLENRTIVADDYITLLHELTRRVSEERKRFGKLLVRYA